MNHDKFFVFDVESIGLYGEGFAFGAVLIDHLHGRILEEWMYSCPRSLAMGTKEDRLWVEFHIPDLAPNCGTTEKVRESFWRVWSTVKATMVADCPFPVEARFLDLVFRTYGQQYSPYPLIDVASVRLAMGLDPLATLPRIAGEEQVHNPLHDARQSARLLIEALES